MVDVNKLEFELTNKFLESVIKKNVDGNICNFSLPP